MEMIMYKEIGAPVFFAADFDARKVCRELKKLLAEDDEGKPIGVDYLHYIFDEALAATSDDVETKIFFLRHAQGKFRGVSK